MATQDHSEIVTGQEASFIRLFRGLSDQDKGALLRFQRAVVTGAATVTAYTTWADVRAYEGLQS